MVKTLARQVFGKQFVRTRTAPILGNDPKWVMTSEHAALCLSSVNLLFVGPDFLMFKWNNFSLFGNVLGNEPKWVMTSEHAAHQYLPGPDFQKVPWLKCRSLILVIVMFCNVRNLCNVLGNQPKWDIRVWLVAVFCKPFKKNSEVEIEKMTMTMLVIRSGWCWCW